MKLESTFRVVITAAAILILPLIFNQNCFPQQTSATHDGQHDFDFHFGKWKSKIQTLSPGSDTWVKLEGTITVNKIWDGQGSLEEIKAEGPSGLFHAATLYLYNPQSGQWSQSFAHTGMVALGSPAVGEFKNGIGEFYCQEQLHGKTVLIRFKWSEIKPDSHRFEKAYSDNGGETWITNLISKVERYQD